MTASHALPVQAFDLPVHGQEGHDWTLLARVPDPARATLLWLPALGIAARHYLPFAEALAARGIAVFLHEWRGHGTSSLRASRTLDWGYRELLTQDIPASEAALAGLVPQVDRFIGGHSLGGQLAACFTSLASDPIAELWLVASGAPYWRSFPLRTGWWLPMAYRFLPWLAEWRGALPGRSIGFGGNEARGVIRDWSRSALSGRYAAHALDIDLEAAMARMTPRVRAVTMRHDWLAPPSSLRFLTGKFMHAQPEVTLLDDDAVGARADHYAWMKQSDAVVSALLR